MAFCFQGGPAGGGIADLKRCLKNDWGSGAQDGPPFGTHQSDVPNTRSDLINMWRNSGSEEREMIY